MAFIDPDTLKAGSTPETSPVAQMPQGSGFIDPDHMPAQQEQKDPQNLQDLSIPRQMMSGAVGGPEAGLSMATGFAGMAAGGIAAVGKGAYNLATKGFIDPDDMHKTSEGVAHAMTYEPRSFAGKEFAEGIGKAFATGREYAGYGGEALSNNSPLARSVAEFGFDATLNALPFFSSLGKVRGAARLKKALEEERMKAEATAKQNEITAEPAQPSARDKPESDYLYNPQQGVESPFVERAGIKEIYDDNYPGGKVIDPDAYEVPQGTSSMDASQTAAGLREREYVGPNEKGDLSDNGIDYNPDLPTLGAEKSGQRWKIVDTKTGQQVGESYSNRLRARSRQDRLDNEYGGYRYKVEPFEEQKEGDLPTLGARKEVDPQEVEWINKAREGDDKAFNELVKKYRPRLERVMKRTVMGDAYEDVVQETLIHAYKGMKNFKGDSGFFTWLYSIAKNDAKNYFAHESRRPSHMKINLEDDMSLEELTEKSPEGHTIETPENQMSARQMRESLDMAMKELPEEFRLAIHLREIEGLSYEDVAKVLRVPINTVRSRLSRGREILQDKIKKLKEDNGGTFGARFKDGNMSEFNSKSLGEVLNRTQNARAGLLHIQRKSETPFYRKLAGKILEDGEFNPQFEVTDRLTSGSKNAGEFDMKDYKIREHPDFASSEQLLLHEAVHARTSAAIQAYLAKGLGSKTWDKHFKHLELPIKRLVSLFESLEKKGMETSAPAKGGTASPIQKVGAAYGMTNLHEFVAEGLANPAFQSHLAQLKVPRELSNKGMFRYYWDSFLDSIRHVMGLDKKEATYLSEVLRASSDLMSGTGRDERMVYTPELRGNRAIGMEIEGLQDTKKDVKEKDKEGGIMRSALDAARDHALDRRPFEEMYKDDIEGRKLQDFSPESENLVKRAYDKMGAIGKAQFLQDSTIALLMRNVEGSGPLIKWVTDNVSRIEREYLTKTKASIDEGLNDFRRLFRSDRSLLENMRDIWVDNIGKRDLDPADFKDERQYKVYAAMQKITDGILKEINAMRASKGYKEIQRIPSYLHATWSGDYRVFGYDAKGDKVWAYGYKTIYGAKADMAKLQKAHPDIKWERTEVKQDKYGLMDLSAFEEAINVMEKDDPVTQAIQQTYRDILQHRGFGKTGLHKTGVKGFEGSEARPMTPLRMLMDSVGVGDKTGLKSLERSFTQYVEQAYRYMGNLKKQEVWADVQKLPKEQRDQLPQTMDFLHSYIERARGSQGLVDWETKILGELGSAVGLGRHAARNGVRGMAQIAYMFYLTTPRFIASQTVQSINAIPKLIQEHGTFNGMKVYYDGLLSTIRPDEVTKEATKWASDRQYLDPTIRNLIHKEWGERPTTSEGIREVMSWPAAWTEHNLVRAPVFIMFEKALREKISDKHERFEVAAQKADYYMVNYNKIHAPAFYHNLGIAGDMLRPLKMYSHNYIGQFLEYLQGAKNNKEYAPLAAFFGTQVAVAGLKGTMFAAEAAVVITLINYLTDSNIPTPEQLLVKGGVHDALTFGGLSYVLGRDVSSSVAAPGLPSMLNFPGVELSLTMMKDVSHFAIEYAKGQETDADRLRAWLAITPSAAHDWLKNLYTPQGYPTANPNDPQLRGNFIRSENERFISSSTGTKSLDEAKADMLMRNVRKELMRDAERKLDAVDAITDRIQNGHQVDQHLFEKYIKNGGDPSALSRNIASRMKERMLTGVERSQEGSVTPQQAHRLGLLQQYMDSHNQNDNPLRGNLQNGPTPPSE